MTDLFGERSGATFSADRVYRYLLWRTWDETLPAVSFCMLNPSTADEEKEDPTVRRCLRFARDWGCGKLIVVNIFALRSTDPHALYRNPDPIGAENDFYIRQAFTESAEMIAAWGNHGAYLERGTAVCKMLAKAFDRPLKHLGITDLGEPRHPLYLRGDSERKEWRIP